MRNYYRFSWPQRFLGVALAGLAMGLGSCTVGRVTELDAGYYQVVQTNDSLLTRAVAGVPRHRFYVEQPAADTLLLYRPAATPGPPLRFGPPAKACPSRSIPPLTRRCTWAGG
jgi:hypothetical protein